MAKSFIFDTKPKMGDQTITLNNTKYILKVGSENCTLHIIAEEGETYSVDLTLQDLKALYYLLTTQSVTDSK